MKVDKIGQNGYLKRDAAPRHAAQSFTGKESKVAQMITESLPQKGAIEKMKSLDWLKGEAGGILITAIGTGLVAPMFIAFNPFVKPPKDATPEQKQDVKNTKIYTAWRQPISAVLAILFQLGALKPIDILLDEPFNNPEYSKNVGLHYDQSVLNGKSYRERMAKNALKQEGKKAPSIFKVFTQGLKKTFEEKREYRKMVADRASEISKEQVSKLAESFRKDGLIKIGERYLDNPTTAELVNKQIDEYVKDAQALKVNNDLLAFRTERAKVLVENEDYLKNLFKDIPIEEINKTSDPNELKKLYEKTETIVKDLYENERNPKIKELLKEVCDRPEDIRANRISRTLSRIDKIKEMCNGEYSPQKYLEAMSRRNAEMDKTITRLKLNKIKEPEKATRETITDTIQKLVDICKFDEKDGFKKSILRDTDTFDASADKLAKKIHKDITKLYKELVENKYKSFNQLTKVCVSVFITLPITCNLLNWVYPRFMELVFPEVSGVKKADKTQGGDK